MKTEDVKALVYERIAEAFPSVVIQIGAFGDDANDICVNVFGVNRQEVDDVESLILDLDWELCSKSGLALTPMVRDIQTTENLYPQFLPAQSTTSPSLKLEIHHPRCFELTVDE